MPLNEHGTVSVEELLRDPIAALDSYSPAPGWNMPLHKRVIQRRQDDFPTATHAAFDETFLRDVHKVVKAWYGKRSWRIVDFDEFQSEMNRVAIPLFRISHFQIESLQDQCGKCHIYDLNRYLSSTTSENFPQQHPTRCCVKCMAEFLWHVILNINLTNGDAKIISGTKVLHHFLPNLLPPMDDKFTGEFFIGKESAVNNASKTRFSDIYSGFVRLARELVKDPEFMARVGVEFNTSLTKTLDNAVIGFVIREDMAMAHAIAEGMKTPVVSKQELLDILQPKHVYRS